MKRSFLEFLQHKQQTKKVFEGFSSKSFDKVNSLIYDIIKKHTNARIAQIPGYLNTISNNTKLITAVYLIDGGRISMNINWSSGNSMDVYSIDFFEGTEHLFTGRGNSILTLSTLGSSIVYFLPIIWTIINSDNYSISQEEAEAEGRKVFNNEVKESLYYVGAIKYKVFESLKPLQIKKIYEETKKANETVSPEALNPEYKEVLNAVQGNVKEMSDLKLAVNSNVPVSIPQDATEQKQEEELKAAHEDPEVAFKKMRHYLDMVIQGTNPALIICGAPGVGKTFRVRQHLKENGYAEGENLSTIKGKCTARKLYTELYNFKEAGDIVLIDDADSLIGKGADENSINILKGALDSTSDKEGRLITYGIAGKIQDDNGNDIPKKFFYNGGVVIITNWNAGNLDTALKGRSFVQDIHFTVEDALQIIKNIMPNIEPQVLSPEAKVMAYDYLVELAKNNIDNMEISIRTFGICAKIFETSLAIGDDFEEEDARKMIEEQMKLQAARKGEKY